MVGNDFWNTIYLAGSVDDHKSHEKKKKETKQDVVRSFHFEICECTDQQLMTR